MGCVLFSSCATFLYLAANAPGDLSEMLLITAIFAVVGGIPLYLIVGIIRITLWAMRESQPD